MSSRSDSRGIEASASCSRAGDGEGERELVERARHDPDAFGELYRRHRLVIFRYARCRMENEADAEDLVSEVFLRALQGFARYRYTGAPFRAWLLQIAAHAVVDEGRRRRRMLFEDLDQHEHLVGAAAVEEQAILRDQARRILVAAERLCTPQRTVFALRLGHDLPTAEVARLLGRSKGAAKLVLHRALTHVRAAVWELAS